MSKANSKLTLYEWKKGDEVLGYGIATNFEGRVVEHTREEPNSVIEKLGQFTTEMEARESGRAKIKDYEQVHGDLPPKNKPR